MIIVSMCDYIYEVSLEDSSNMIYKVYTHSVNGFKQYVKNVVNCYICSQN